MNLTIEEFFEELRTEISAAAEALCVDSRTQFVSMCGEELSGSGFVEDLQLCIYRATQGGMGIDGYWYDEDEKFLSLFIADYSMRQQIETLTKTKMDAIFKRLDNFFNQSRLGKLAAKLEISSEEYALSKLIERVFPSLAKINFVIISERRLSERINDIEQQEIDGIPIYRHLWDLERFYQQAISRGQREPIYMDFSQVFDDKPGVPCLSARMDNDSMESYLAVVPGRVLAELYEKYGSRLLEQNVRAFLQDRGNVNKGIKRTIVKEPDRFFVYNNGIVATAKKIEVTSNENGKFISNVLDLQIVNGGQTTASLFHTRRKEKVPLDKIFVQMKLTIIDDLQEEKIVGYISQYANTQNKIDATDFFSNSPFNIRMEEFSRRILAPAKPGSARATKWYYERTRGQYVEAMSKFSKADKNKFQMEYPKYQKITKEDIAKYEHIWTGTPYLVSRGKQKNYKPFIEKLDKEWKQAECDFNEYYYKCMVAKAILFAETQKIVSSQPWYQKGGSLRSHIVYYAQACLGEIARRKNRIIAFINVWEKQELPEKFKKSIAVATQYVNSHIIGETEPRDGEWFKKEVAWSELKRDLDSLEKLLGDELETIFIEMEEENANKKHGVEMQKIDDGIASQKKVLTIPPQQWKVVMAGLASKRLLSPKEIGILQVGMQIPSKLPSEKQAAVLLRLLDRAEAEGIIDKS